MEFRILGPLEVVADGRPVALGGRRQRLVLACLLVRAKRPVATSTLIDEVWGDDPPDAARNSLQSYVSHLRKALGDARIRTTSSGYLLDVEPDDIDAWRFENLVEVARAEAMSDPRTAAATFGRALSLWRGSALADLAGELSLLGEIARLEELRLSAIEHKLAAELAAGHHSAVVGDLEALTGRHGLRERLWAQLMLALYRSGRQGDALAAYQRARATLAEELGVDPSPELRELHDRILRQDPALRAPTSVVDPTTTPPGRPVGELDTGRMFAGYRIERVLGHGGTSVVYLAEQQSLGRHVALKVLGPWLNDDPAFRDRFIRESKLAASLDHPNIVPIYEAGEHDGRLFIAMRYVAGTDLRRRLSETGALAAGDVTMILRQVAAALDVAHAHGLVHRDVKPANVLLAHAAGPGSGEPAYLSDFGLTTRTVGDSSPASGFMGTLDYAAPEQFQGAPLDGRADQYSLGCVLHECLTGSPPFRRRNQAALMRAHLDEPPPTVTTTRPELPAAIDDVVARALAKVPDERFASCGAFAEAVAAVLSPATTSTPRPSDAARSTRHARRHRRARRWLVGGLAAALAAAAGVFAVTKLADRSTAGALERYEPGMAIIDATTGKGIAHIPTSVVREPVEAIYGDGSFWVLDLEPLSFVQIDAQTGRVQREIASPIDDVGYFTVDGDDLWITHYTEPILSRVDIRRGKEIARFDVPGAGGSGGVLVADGSLWVARRDADGGLGILARLDPDTGEVEHLFHRLPGSYALAYGDDGAVWTAGTFGAVNRIDPRTNEVTSVDVGGRNFYVAAGDGFGWTTDEAKGVVYQVDSSGSVVASHPTDLGARAVSYSDGLVWVGNQDTGTLTALQVATGATTTYRFSHPLNSIAAGAGRVLVELASGKTFDELLAELDGNVAKLFTGGYELDPPDAALVSSDVGVQVEQATCAGLVRYVDARSADGERVEPEVAAAMPRVSPDRLTYTFTIRPGYRFSPPVSGEQVTAETFRASIERALSPGLGSDTPGPAAIGDIAGESEFRSGGAQHISGLRAEGATLSITLVAPSDDFLERLARPYFCPVPVGTPISVEGGASVPVDARQDEVMVASAGPYYIARFVNGEYTFLLRNPNYNGPRPHRFDAIVMREGVDPEFARSLVDAGAWDGIIHMWTDGSRVGRISDQIGCRSYPPEGEGIDLAAMCRVSS